MKTHAIFVSLLLLFTLFAGVNGTIADGEEIKSGTLYVVTRHSSDIYLKYQTEFLKSTYALDAGITSMKFLSVSTYEGFTKLIDNPDTPISVAWGGGPTLFNALYSDGYIVPMSSSGLLNYISENINDTFAGSSLKKYDGENLVWVGSAVSSFGFTVNHKVLQDRGLPTPVSWEDLASPDFFSSSTPNVGLGNAPDTTSNTRVYQILLQKYGWEKGWELMTRMAGNGQIYGGSVETQSSVISGEVAAAITIDFYGYNAQLENPNTEYIVPKNGSIVNADPIAITKNAGNIDYANAFINFVLSPEGQSVLLDKKINRMPVRSDAFDTPAGQSRGDLKENFEKTLLNKGIDFDEEFAESIYNSMRYYWQASIRDVDQQLRSMWKTLVSDYRKGAYSENKFFNLSAEMGMPVVSIKEMQDVNSELATASGRLKYLSEWSDLTIQKFDHVEQLRVAPEIFNSTTKDYISYSNTVTDISLSSYFIVGIVVVGLASRKLPYGVKVYNL